MKQKNIIFLFSMLSISMPMFCMEQSIKNITPEDMQKNPQGYKIYGNILHQIRNQKLKNEQSKLVKIIAANLVDFSLYKAVKSKDEISQELKDIPVIGTAFKIPGIAFLTNSFTKFVINRFVDFEEALQRSSDIKRYMAQVLQNTAEEAAIFERETTTLGQYPWTQKIFKPKKAKNKIQQDFFYDILCTAVVIAKHNKIMFEEFLKMAKVSEKLHDYFHKQLACSADLEDKIKISCFKKLENNSDFTETELFQEVIPQAPEKDTQNTPQVSESGSSDTHSSDISSDETDKDNPYVTLTNIQQTTEEEEYGSCESDLEQEFEQNTEQENEQQKKSSDAPKEESSMSGDNEASVCVVM